jgi:hypothetical protein
MVLATEPANAKSCSRSDNSFRPRPGLRSGREKEAEMFNPNPIQPGSEICRQYNDARLAEFTENDREHLKSPNS